MAEDIFGLVIPKYGMVMSEGAIAAWHVDVGAFVSKGDELVDIETEKVTNSYESPRSGILRRKVVPAGRSAPIGALFGVIADQHIEEARIDAFVEEFNARFAGAQAQASGPSPEIIKLESGDVRFLKRGEGGGLPVVFVHGFAGDLNSWILNHDAIAASRPAYAIDLPGHGGSQKTRMLESIDDLASTLEEFLDALSLASVHLVGHSLGGGISARLALDLPKRVASSTLLAPIGVGREINATFIQGMLNADRRTEMKAVLESLFHDPALVSRDMVKNVLQSKRIDGAVDALRRIAERCIGTEYQVTNLREGLLKHSVPMQVIWGRSDQIIPCAHAANLPQRILVHELEEAGHMVHMEKPREVNGLISRFVAENES